QTICFQVSDTGIGISKEEIKRIFQPFHQVDNRIDRNFTGCGLGLAICKELLEAMGSQLQVESTPGEGSVFSFTLTLDEAPQSLPKAKKHTIERKATKNLKVLFVDDDPVNRLLGSIILRKCRAKADFAKSGAEAMKTFHPGKYPLIFLDINMPGMNGLEVIRSLREREKNYPGAPASRVVAMTANTVRKQIREYLKAGMNSVMLKPYNEETFIKHIISATPPALVSEKEVLKEESPLLNLNEAKLFDLDQLRQITRGDQDFMQLMLNSFIENGELMQKKIISDLKKEDYRGIAEAAHRLHPSAEQLGMEKATVLLKKIEEKYLRKNNYKPDPQLIQIALNEIAIAISAIKTVLK
ncbi:MAG: response regulator, partial [Bacteroidetes bacterium]